MTAQSVAEENDLEARAQPRGTGLRRLGVKVLGQMFAASRAKGVTHVFRIV